MLSDNNVACFFRKLIDCQQVTDKELTYGAGWSSLVARQAHNLKVVGSNPTPATNNN